MTKRTRKRFSIQQLIAAAVVVTVCFGAGWGLTNAAAASLGGLTAGLGTWTMFPEACDDEFILVIADDSGEAELSGVASECFNLDGAVTIYDEEGNAIGEATFQAGSESFTIDFGEELELGDIVGAIAVVGGRVIPIDLTVEDTGFGNCLNCTVEVEITSDEYAQYCATATITGTEGTSQNPVEWMAIVDMTDYPLEGTLTGAGNLHTAVDFTHIDGILTFWGNPNKGGWQSNVWVGKSFTINWCAERDIPTDGNIWLVLDNFNDWGSGFCATFSIHTDEAAGVEWTYEFDLSGPPYNGVASVTSAWNFQRSVNGQQMLAWGQGGVWQTSYTFVNKPAVNMGFCANR